MTLSDSICKFTYSNSKKITFRTYSAEIINVFWF